MKIYMYLTMGLLLFCAFTITMLGIVGGMNTEYGKSFNDSTNLNSLNGNISQLVSKSTELQNTLTNLTEGKEDATGLIKGSYNVMSKVMPTSMSLSFTILGTVGDMFYLNGIINWTNILFSLLILALVFVVLRMFFGRWM